MQFYKQKREDKTIRPEYIFQDLVFIARKMVLQSTGYTILGTSRDRYPNLRGLLVSDPDAVKVTNAAVLRKCVDERIQKVILEL